MLEVFSGKKYKIVNQPRWRIENHVQWIPQIVSRIHFNLCLGRLRRKALGKKEMKKMKVGRISRCNWDIHKAGQTRFHLVHKILMYFTFSLTLFLLRVFYKCEIRTQESIIRIFWYFWFRRLWTGLHCTGTPGAPWPAHYLTEDEHPLSFTWEDREWQLTMSLSLWPLWGRLFSVVIFVNTYTTMWLFTFDMHSFGLVWGRVGELRFLCFSNFS